MTLRTRRADVAPFVTADRSLVRELMHPARHAARAQSLAEAIVPPGGATLLHRHARSEETYHFTRGAGRMRLGDESFDVRAGDTVVVPPGTAHGLQNPDLGPLVLLCACAPAYSHEDTELLEAPLDDEAQRMHDEARLDAFLNSRKVDARQLRFERPCGSVAEAAEAAGARVDQFVKSVALLAPDGYGETLVVGVVKGEDRLDPARLADALSLDAPPRLARPDELRAYAGYPAGGLPPLGYEARIVLDERVLDEPRVCAGGGSDRALLDVAPDALLRSGGGRDAHVARIRKAPDA